MSNNNNNNNNNNENQTEQERNYPNSIFKRNIVYFPTLNASIKAEGEAPRLTQFGREILSNYTNLNFFLKKESLTIQEIKDFLKQFYICLLNTEGYTNEEMTSKKLQNQIEPCVKNGKCIFLGNEKDTSQLEAGCKLLPNPENPPEKLTSYVEFMMKFLIYIFKYKVTENTKQQVLKDEETMNLLEKAIRNLFYFYGQKLISPPFKSANALFSSFVDQMNALFGGFRILRLTCPKEEYGCGRFVTINKCNTSGQYYVIIHKTGGDDNRNVAVNLGEISNKERSSCGGARKTKRSTKKRKIRKTRKI